VYEIKARPWLAKDLGRSLGLVLTKTRRDERHQDQASAWSCQKSCWLVENPGKDFDASNAMQQQYGSHTGVMQVPYRRSNGSGGRESNCLPIASANDSSHD